MYGIAGELLVICGVMVGAAGKPVPAPNTLTPKQKAEGWQMLFNGKDLEGWSVKSGFAKYKAEGGAIVGTTAKGSPNSFLTSKASFRDFELMFQVLLDSNQLNSGVQIRSKLRGKKYGGRVYGPQVEIERSPGQSGFIYGEAAGGWQSPEPKSKDKSVNQHSHFRNGKWNTYRVRAVGRHIQTWINGHKIADLVYDKKRYEENPEGIIGLQVHGVGKRGPFSVRWRSIYVKKLDAGKTDAEKPKNDSK